MVSRRLRTKWDSPARHTVAMRVAGESAVEEAETAISGSGDCNVFSNGDMEVSIAGRGDVQYKGNARVDASISGSGKAFSKD